MKTILLVLFVPFVLATAGCRQPAQDQARQIAALENRLTLLEARQTTNQMELDYLDTNGGQCFFRLRAEVHSNANEAFDFTDKVWEESISNGVAAAVLKHRFDRLISNNPSLRQ